MRQYLGVAAVVLAACGGTGAAPPGATAEPRHVSITRGAATGGLRTTSSGGAKVDTIWASFDRVWKALPGVYGLLDIPIANFDAEKNLIGNEDLKLYRRLGKVSLTKLIDCGTTQIGPNADSYEVRLSVLTTIQRSKTDTSLTTIATRVDAMAKPVAFAGEYRQCTSKAALEEQLLKTLMIQLHP